MKAHFTGTCQVILYVHVPFTCGRSFLALLQKNNYRVFEGYHIQHPPEYFERYINIHRHIAIEFHTPISPKFVFGFNANQWRSSRICRMCCCNIVTHVDKPYVYAGRFFSHAGTRLSLPYDNVLSLQLAKQLNISVGEVSKAHLSFDAVGSTSTCHSLLYNLQRRNHTVRVVTPRNYSVPRVSLRLDELLYSNLMTRQYPRVCS